MLRSGTRAEQQALSRADHGDQITLPSPFKSAPGKAQYLAAYERLMRLWPVPYEPLDLTGRFGRTHVVASGPTNAPPLMLLHGYLATLTMWSANTADLSRDYRVYAIDVMGQPSKSIPDPTAPIAGRADFVMWLTEVLDALHIDRAAVVGMSYGGWLTLNYAIGAHERVTKIALLSPAGSFLPNVRQFTLRALPIMVFRRRFLVESFLHWLTFKDNLRDPGVRRFTAYQVDLFHLGQKHFRQQRETLKVAPLPYSDAELRGLQVPTLLLIGQQEVLYDPAAALERARRLIPTFEGELVARAAHDMSYSRHDVVDARVLRFLKDAPTD
jgi:pimeloyl-ACP methyl ester carboxylesterase